MCRAVFWPPCSTTRWDLRWPRARVAATLQLSVTFLRPARIGLLHGTGRVVRRGREVCHLAGELRQDGEVVASALATALVRQARPSIPSTSHTTP